MKIKTQVVIIGAGPAGIAAAVELQKNNISFELINKGTIGGKVNIAPKVTNYPHKKSLTGPELSLELKLRLAVNGIKPTNGTVQKVYRSEDGYWHTLAFISDQGVVKEYVSDVILVTSGTRSRVLNLEHEQDLVGKQLAYSAVDNVDLFKDKKIAIVGGGNSALKEAEYLSNYAKKIYLIHRRNEFRGLQSTLNIVKSLSNIKILTPWSPQALVVNKKNILKKLVLKNSLTAKKKKLTVDAVLFSVGYFPSIDFLDGSIVTDDSGYIKIDSDRATNLKGLFAAGDVVSRTGKQIYASEVDARKAVNGIIKYLNKRED